MVFIDVYIVALLVYADMHCIIASRCKGTALGHVQKVDGSTCDGFQFLSFHIYRRNGLQKSLGV